MPDSSHQPRSSPRSSWIIALVVVGAVGSCGLVLLPVGVYALRSHLLQTRVAETQQNMVLLAAGLAQCAPASQSERRHGLPPTAQPVPRAMASISGRRYQSRTLDWQDEAYQCARFALSVPQAAQLQWIRSSDSEGYVRGILDLDGDLIADVILEQAVKCKDDLCTPGEIVQKR